MNQRAADEQAQREAEAESRRRDRLSSADGASDLFPQPRISSAGDQAEGCNLHWRGFAGLMTGAYSRDEGPVELPAATLTPPSTYRSPYAETATENGTVLDTDGLRSPIQTLHSQFEIESRRRAELEQQLAYAESQLQQYSVKHHAVQELQGAAVMNDNESKVVKLELRAERMKKLWDESRADVRRLEEELEHKNEVIEELEREITSRMLETQLREAQQQEAAHQEAALQEAALQEAAHQEAQQQEAQQQKAQLQEAQLQEVQLQAPQQQEVQLQAPQQQAPQRQQPQRLGTSNTINGRGTANHGRSRRRSSNMSLSRNAAGVEIIRGENAYAVSGGPALALLRTL
jgi:hypothetical protein